MRKLIGIGLLAALALPVYGQKKVWRIPGK